MLSKLLSFEFWWAVMLGVTPAVGLMPAVYCLYFALLGWPHPYMTHNGPLWGTEYVGPLWWINIVFVTAFPLTTLLLALKHVGGQRDLSARLSLALPLVQFAVGLANFVLLFMLSD